MKCQRCSKHATHHITEVYSPDSFEEVHLCEECVLKYLKEPLNKSAAVPSGPPPGVTAAVAPVEDPASKKCDACGLTFVEFRNTSRLGCPNDYEAFREELLPLLESIHGDAKHNGKAPRRLPQAKSIQQELVVLRKRLTQAVNNEAYEEAARIRDAIRELEQP